MEDDKSSTSSWWTQSSGSGWWASVALGLLASATMAYVHYKENRHLHLDKPFLTTYHQQFADKTIIVTGANTGVGYHAAKQLASYNAKIILACRDGKRAENAMKSIIAATGNKDVTYEIVDLADFRSIEHFASRVGKCHILINNAAAVFTEAGNIRDVDRSFLTNYLGPWYLTRLILPKLLHTSVEDDCEVKIVNVGSRSEKMVPLGGDFQQHGAKAIAGLFEGPKTFKSMIAYGYSKLADMLFSYELHRRLHALDEKTWWKSSLITYNGRLATITPMKIARPRVAVNTVTPGMTNTDLIRNANSALLYASYPLRYVMLKTAAEGGSEVVFAASQQVSGKYFGEHQEIESSETARSIEIANILWQQTEEFFNKKQK